MKELYFESYEFSYFKGFFLNLFCIKNIIKIVNMCALTWLVMRHMYLHVAMWQSMRSSGGPLVAHIIND